MGALFGVSFLVILCVIFSPIFGEGKNGLQFSDDLFNKLSKGSSFFIPDVRKHVEPYNGQSITANVKAANPDLAIKMLMAAGAQVGREDAKLKVTGDLGKILSVVLTDSEAMYHNKGNELAARYGSDGDADTSAKKALKTWWEVLNTMIFDLQLQKKIEQAKATDQVLKKGIEPAYNFYGIAAESVSSKALLMISLLIFYVIYTMWWGYAIFFMFEGIGLSMKKAKVKKEV